MAATNSNDKLAVLIDADNAQASLAQELLAEVSRYGIANVKRAYGDWTTTNLKGWKDILHKMAIQPVQQFRYTTGKNATDSSLIIDAMDLLHTGSLDGFCLVSSDSDFTRLATRIRESGLVSSDSDFTRLATRIRESGLVVYGFGQEKTPDAFVAACDKFIYTEILKPTPSPSSPELRKTEPLKPMLIASIEATARDDGWAALSAVGSMLLKNSPSFDPRNYHCQKLGELVRKQRYLQVKEVPQGGGSGNVQLYVRKKAA